MGQSSDVVLQTSGQFVQTVHNLCSPRHLVDIKDRSWNKADKSCCYNYCSIHIRKLNQETAIHNFRKIITLTSQ